jgi:hypothetical protein
MVEAIRVRLAAPRELPRQTAICIANPLKGLEAWRLFNASFSDKKYTKVDPLRLSIVYGDKVIMPALECELVYGCNLRCIYCSHHNAFRHGMPTKKYLENSFAQWSKKLEPHVFKLLGGEPLLHPDFVEICLMAKKYFENSQIEVTSNGLLLPKITDVEMAKLHGVISCFVLSKHFDTPVYNKNLLKWQERLRKFGILSKIEDSYTKWRKPFKTNEKYEPLFAHSAPDEAYAACLLKPGCHTIEGIGLWRCGIVHHSKAAAEQGVIDGGFLSLQSHRPMHPQNTTREIVDYLTGDAMPECAMCPTIFPHVPSIQIPLRLLRKAQ